MSTSQLCEPLAVAIKSKERFEQEAAQVLKEFAEYYTDAEKITIEPIMIKSGNGIWSLQADILYNGEIVQHYPLADLALLDLNELMLRREIERQKKG